MMIYSTPPQPRNFNGGFAPAGQVRRWHDARSYAMAGGKVQAMFPGSKMTEMFHNRNGQLTKAYINDDGEMKTVSFDANQHVSQIQDGCR